MTSKQVDALFDNITVYNEMNKGVQISRFSSVKIIGSIFTPIATYYQENVRSNDEWVAIIEGINFPFFGISFSIEKVLFNYDILLEDYLDFSKNSILHA